MRGDVIAASLVAATLNAIACALGGLAWRRSGLAPDAPAHAGLAPERAAQAELARAFWLMLRLAQGATAVLALGVGVLAAAGSYSSERLFYLYALLPLAIAFIAEQLRVASAQTVLDQRGLADAAAVGALLEAEQQRLVSAIVRREIGVMTLSALVVVFLLLRAASTAHGF